ncbi:exocyst complex component 8 [Phlebotomus argentipes]|uniref:exocyst complex component 8 n=1 Tax=Phlebotomus argentipes TaxID=94469 RepID=UPI002892C058|nr:exocyst complex component 8 [Phlebotomus argentipes]
MPESSNTVFDTKGFKAEDHVRGLVQECVGGPELLQRKAKIQTYSDQTSTALKKHVYDNYMKFIDTAKEISQLESEMYQLSHILIEQRNLLGTLRESHVVDDPRKVLLDGDGSGDKEAGPRSLDAKANEETQNRNTVALIRESLSGYSGVLDNKTFVHEGGLIELDSNDYRPICRTYFFLFSDTLIVAKVKHDKNLEFLAEYESKKLAVINIRDLDGVRNAINIITPDGSRIFQCISPSAKAEWIEKFEVSMKGHQRHRKGPAPAPPMAVRQKSIVDTVSLSSDATLSPTTEHTPLIFAPDWLSSAPEEIQALIAQRHFEDTLALLQKCEEYLARDSAFHGAAEMREKMKNLKASLVSVLLLELSASQSRSLQAALRSARRPLKLLAEMRKAREACGALLGVCTTAIRTAQRQARRNNLGVAEIFFCDLAQVVAEFVGAFGTQAACTASLVVWCHQELQYFASQLIKHYLGKGTDLEAVANCVELVRVPCGRLTEIGLDVGYHIEGLLRPTLEGLLAEAKERLIGATQRIEDNWQPCNLRTKQALRSTMKEFEAFGISLKPLVTGDTFISLTQSTVNFCRQFFVTTLSCATLAKYETLKQDAEVLVKELFVAQFGLKADPSAAIDLNFVSRNKQFLVDRVLPAAIALFESTSGRSCELLPELKALATKTGNAPKPKPRSIYQTDVL